MTVAGTLLATLHRAGVHLRREGDQLVAEAPTGVLTPDLKEELLRLKQDLLQVLDQEVDDRAVGDELRDARRSVAALLSAAYQRYKNDNRPPVAALDAAVGGLALSTSSSVHGVVK